MCSSGLYVSNRLSSKESKRSTPPPTVIPPSNQMSSDAVCSFSASMSCILVTLLRYVTSSASCALSPKSFSNCDLVSPGTDERASASLRPISASPFVLPATTASTYVDAFSSIPLSLDAVAPRSSPSAATSAFEDTSDATPTRSAASNVLTSATSWKWIAVVALTASAPEASPPSASGFSATAAAAALASLEPSARDWPTHARTSRSRSAKVTSRVTCTGLWHSCA
mmetsp:Transcript_7149/g.31474  ORF Transcript_7149/g.31474 Transcript_7149/m.31474 type:complete len:226 (-) Transcript_7149:466-1143(-)